jgi:hypothetical protein
MARTTGAATARSCSTAALLLLASALGYLCSSASAFLLLPPQQQPSKWRPRHAQARAAPAPGAPAPGAPALAAAAAATTTSAGPADAAGPVGPDAALGTVLASAGKGRRKLDLSGAFGALTQPGSLFMEQYWQRAPCFTDAPIPCLDRGYTMADVEAAVAKEFLLAGRGFFNEEQKGGWKMALVGQARGSSFEDAKLRPEDVRAALGKRSGTVVFNSIDGSVAPLARVSLDAVEAFRLPVALNMYLTAPGQQTSAPPHTDKQDVFVLQTQGKKRWRVYAPPAPAAKPGPDPFARGKDQDVLRLDELGPPLIDTVLGPGQMLYMPAGFPHTTDTVVGIVNTGEKDASVHLTLGVDTHIWGLTHACLRDYVLYRLDPTAFQPHTPPPLTQTDVQAFMQYHGQVPLGAREPATLLESLGAQPRWSQIRKALAAHVQAEFWAVMRAVEPESPHWQGEAPSGNMAAALQETIERVVDHHRALTACFRDMYSDVAHGLTDVPRDLGFFRSQPYYARIEKHMQALVEWAAPPASASAAAGGGAGAVAAASPVPMATEVAAAAAEGGGAGAGAKGGFGGGSSKGGFGGGGGGGGGAKKGGKKKK